MPQKTRKVSKKNRRRTLRRIPRRPKKGGQQLAPPPDSAFKHVSPTNSDNIMGGIAYNK